MRRVAILISDSGDGSACLRWFKNIEWALSLADADKYCEEFGMNEGSPEVIDVDDNWEPTFGWNDNDYSLEDEEDE